MNKRHAAAAATALTLAFTVAACSSGGDGADSSASSAESGTTVSHIHGLGLDPSDQRLYVATHAGIYTPDANGKPKLVGDSKDDFMGFTVGQDKTFYASGHPSSGSDSPGNKGLIKSTDAGETWTSLSLSGESDFHALDYAHGTVYGYDATNGLLRTSKDGSSWKDGAQLEALDIAVSPNDADLVLATTADGVARSTDGGKTFAKGEQPVMAYLSWKAEDALYGIDPSGGLNRSTDGGATWKKLTTVPGGQPQALTSVDSEHVLAATQDGVYESKDGGKTFTKRLAVESNDGH
ncbi:exo-alpha-sialidase [Streptomyces sp. PSKA54]|uniref:Exo-alpha-sialidase n=1 Tax=Streptomyces himalayensis subsp. aureolus TaxID=2758039 RepID=A0A7W2HHV5_9ACTN|nr:exo-alpha-sialidase [Streptomyces himalayensis]MBA4864164.1 exo-alpha-sialidase [Streptomyces himalayensis subsp. aureolus]